MATPTTADRARSSSEGLADRHGRPAGVEGNERLTGVTGALLLPLLAVEGVTILFIGQLITVHLFVGLVLLAPIALKLASTGYRFIGYYAGRPLYRRKGPPVTPLRILGVGVVVTTIAVMASGVALLLAGPGSRHPLVLVHKVSFIAWIAVTAVHVLAHLLASLTSVRAELRGSRVEEREVGGRGARLSLIAATVLAGVVLALVAIPRYAPWQHRHGEHDVRSAQVH